MAIRWTVAASFLLLAITSAGSARGSGVVRDSVGPISSGRGGTNIAYGDNGAVLLSNPAGMMNMPGENWIEGGVDVLATDLNYSDPQNRSRHNSEVFGLPMLSYMHRDVDDGWAAGIGVFIPAGFGADWDLNAPFPGGQEYQYRSLGGLVKILPGVAFQVTDDLSIGATLGLAVSHAELEGPFFLQTGAFSGVPTRLDMKGTGVAPTWSLGMQYKLTDQTTIGAAYTSEDRFNLDGEVTATVMGLAPVPITSDFDAQVDLVWPQSFGVGIQHIFSDRHRVGADVVWYGWSHAFDRLDLQLSDPSHPAFQALAPTISDSFSLSWEDSITVRTGYEFLYSQRDIFRLGYVYNSNTVPTGTLTPYIPALLDHTVSTGYTRIFRKDLRFNVAYQYAFGDTRDVGISNIVGGDFSQSSVDSDAHWLFLSLSQSF